MTAANKGSVQTKAFFRATERLGLSDAELVEVLNLGNAKDLHQLRKEGFSEAVASELSLHVIRVYRSLYYLNGGDTEVMRHFLRTRNTVLDGVPSELMKDAQGLKNVAVFLESLSITTY